MVEKRREIKPAEPGATDNLGYAQRIRKGFRFRSSEARYLSFIVGQGMKVAIVGNSGSGKSTLARLLAAGSSTAVLDLDLVFWNPGPVERPSAERVGEVQRFCRDHESWIIEGCYADLIEASFAWNPELIFMDPGREVCISNCRNRPHEPHKYRTKEEQDEKLDFLIGWVADYYERYGLMSYRAHKELFDRYQGPKSRVADQKPAQPGATDNPNDAQRL